MKGLRSIRPLSRESLRGLEPGVVDKKVVPKFEWVDPKTLYVEEGYQRDVAEAGTTLIRKIYSAFNWARFKPPVCVRAPEFGNSLICIDGQHTAIAAASHPGIDKIPVMVVSASDVQLRAASFVGHNRDRIALTPPVIYHGELAAGDPIALLVDRACRSAGVTVLHKSINLRDKQPVGVTIAIGTMKAVGRKRGEEALARVLRVLVAAGRGPIKADEIAAVALILGQEPDSPKIDDRLPKVIASKTTEAWAAMGAAAITESREPLPSAVASIWCRQMGIRFGKSAGKASRPRSGATRLIARLPEPEPAPAVSRDVEPPARRPEPPKAPPPPTPPPVDKPVAGSGSVAPAPPQPVPSRLVERNGVRVDLDARKLTHRGRTIVIQSEEEIGVVAALTRVMPAMLDASRLVKVAFGSVGFDSPGRLHLLIAAINPVLRKACLEIKTFPKMGSMLFDLGG